MAPNAILQAAIAAVFRGQWQAMEDEMARRWLSPDGPIVQGLVGALIYPWGLAFAISPETLKVKAPSTPALEVFRNETISSIDLFIHEPPQGGNVTFNLKRYSARTRLVESLVNGADYPILAAVSPARPAGPLTYSFLGSRLLIQALIPGDWLWLETVSVGDEAANPPTPGRGATVLVRWAAAASKER